MVFPRKRFHRDLEKHREHAKGGEEQKDEKTLSDCAKKGESGVSTRRRLELQTAAGSDRGLHRKKIAHEGTPGRARREGWQAPTARSWDDLDRGDCPIGKGTD